MVKDTLSIKSLIYKIIIYRQIAAIKMSHILLTIELSSMVSKLMTVTWNRTSVAFPKIGKKLEWSIYNFHLNHHCSLLWSSRTSFSKIKSSKCSLNSIEWNTYVNEIVCLESTFVIANNAFLKILLRPLV